MAASKHNTRTDQNYDSSTDYAENQALRRDIMAI
jgi:hypothetical protein